VLIKLLILFLPWRLKRWVLQRRFGYVLDPSARIGWAWVYPKHLRMGKETRIDHFTVGVHLDAIELGDFATIGRSNWITGHPGDSNRHFTHQTGRRPQLIVGEHSAITKHHYLDCTHEIRVGRFTTIAGHHSELLTHSIDIIASRQDSHPIEIGDYCFIGTRCIILGGGRLPSQSVLAAGAVLTKPFDVCFAVYGGVPARHLKDLPKDALYFHRPVGFVS
jgi:acetyltransferase-like isoleucine patch superfamily enzyme